MIHLVGFNTALLSADDHDEGKLELGNQQLAKALTAVPDEPSNAIIIVLSHHPFDWLRDGRNVEEWTRKKAHVHLCGHIHEARVERLRSGGGGDFLRIVSGAAHGERMPPNIPARHGYSFGSILAFDDGRCALRVWPRLWSQTNRDFRIDVDNVPDNQSYAEHGLRFSTHIRRSLIGQSPTDSMQRVGTDLILQKLSDSPVAPEIARELQSILGNSVVRKDVPYTLTILPPYEGMLKDFLIIRREIIFKAKNITDRTINYPSRSFISTEFEDINVHDIFGNQFIVPRHIDLKINGKPPTNGLSSALIPDERGRLRQLQYEVSLVQGEECEIYTSCEEPRMVYDRNTYIQPLTIGLTVLVKNEYSQHIQVTDISLFSPNWRQFTRSPDGIYRYNGALLPGQAFSVSWQPIQANK